MSGNTNTAVDAQLTTEATQADIEAALSEDGNDATNLFDGVPQDASEDDVEAALEALEISHETDTEYSGSFDDLTVTSEVVELTGIEDISEFDGFTHRGEVLSLSDTIDHLRHQLYFEHSHHGEVPQPQTAITAHAAADRIATALEGEFESWMVRQGKHYFPTVEVRFLKVASCPTAQSPSPNQTKPMLVVLYKGASS